MRLAPPQHRAYTYQVTVPPVGGPVSLTLFKQHINVTHTLTDELLQVYLNAAVEFAEKYTNVTLINRTYTTFRDFFPNPNQSEGYYTYGRVPTGASTLIPSTIGNVGFELRRSPVTSVSSIIYTNTDNNSITVDPAIYYLSAEKDYSEVLLLENRSWPTDLLHKLQSVSIVFVAGQGATDADIEACWKVAIMNHAAMLWANRGDCSDGNCLKELPLSSKAFYDQKRIISV